MVKHIDDGTWDEEIISEDREHTEKQKQQLDQVRAAIDIEQAQPH